MSTMSNVFKPIIIRYPFSKSIDDVLSDSTLWLAASITYKSYMNGFMLIIDNDENTWLIINKDIYLK